MTFFERYSQIAEKIGLEPCSQRAADLFGVTKSAISSWGAKKTTPKGETVALMADSLGVSADYLLGRTDDPTDYAKGAVKSETITPVQKVRVPEQRATPSPEGSVLTLLSRLDDGDRIRAEGVIQGMLMAEKYINVPAPGQNPVLMAAHDDGATLDEINEDVDLL